MNVNEAIVRRRAIRNFASTPIPDDVLQEILEAARWAPSGGNGQNCCYGVVTDETKKKELAQAAGEQMWIASAPVVIALCSQISYNTADLQEDDFSLTETDCSLAKGYCGTWKFVRTGEALVCSGPIAAP